MRKISKTFLFLSMIALVIWLGSYITRYFSVFSLFEPESLTLNKTFDSTALSGALTIIASIITISFFSYPFFIICFIIFIITSKMNIKHEGWLFMMIVIVIITSPFEIFLMTFDYKYLISIVENIQSNDYLLSQLVKRIKALNSFPIIEILTYFFFIFLFIFRPFRKLNHEN